MKTRARSQKSEVRSQKKACELPCPADVLVPHRPPMLLVRRILEREGDTALLDAVVPPEGMFCLPDGGVILEYFIELTAQAMAAVNGFDARKDGLEAALGFLVGIDGFSFYGNAGPGETVLIELEKTFAFDKVTIMSGRVRSMSNEAIAEGTLKVWEEKG